MGDGIFGGLPDSAEGELNAVLRDFVESKTLPLYEMMSYQLGWGREEGEAKSLGPPPRLHGGLTLATAFASSGDYGPAISHAVSVEMMNSFWLIHNDIEDGNTERAGRPSVWWNWGPAQAINAGDGMHAMARLALFGLSEQDVEPKRVAMAIKALDEAAVKICEGEYADIANQERMSMTVTSYLEMVDDRVGVLFGCAARLGALAVSEDADLADGLDQFGAKIGSARQLAEDYLTLWPTGERDTIQQGRMITKKKNLPVINVFATAEPKTKRLLGEMYMQRVLEPSVLDDVAQLCESAGGREVTRSEIDRLLHESDAGLERSGLAPQACDLLREAGRALVPPCS